MEILLVLGLPVLGSILLALFGARRFAAELNAGMSLATLVVSSLLVLRVIRYGPMLVGHEQFFVDSFNVFLVELTAFVGFTTALFSALTCALKSITDASPLRACASTTACTNSSWGPCCWRCSPITWACCGSPWRRLRFLLSCWFRCTVHGPAWRRPGSTSSCAVSALPKPCSELSCCISPRSKRSGTRA